VLEEHTADAFEREQYAPSMVTVDIIREHVRATISAATHVDGTGRLESVNRPQNSEYYERSQALCCAPRVPLLLNPSFRYRDGPIVGTPGDVLRCFCSVQWRNRFPPRSR